MTLLLPLGLQTCPLSDQLVMLLLTVEVLFMLYFFVAINFVFPFIHHV